MSEIRLIDANALIEKLKSDFDDTDVYTDKDQFIIDCIHLLNNAPTVEPCCDECEKCQNAYDEGYEFGITTQRPQGEWISVSERLPDEKLFNPSGSDFGFDFEEVLCTTVWKDVRAYKFGKPIGHDKPHFWLGGGIMDEYVIAWQPLPEPYKKDEWICPNCDLYEHTENDYCQYAGECTIGCHQCRYFEQKGGAE